MAISKYTLYKYVKVDGTWRYCKAAFHDNAKIKPDIVFVNAKEGLVEKHFEGRYYMSHNGSWVDAGTDAVEAQRKRKQRLALDEYNRLNSKTSAHSLVVPGSSSRITLAAAAEKYFANCEARGLDPETIRKYRTAVDPFVEHCGVTYVDECRDNKQVLLNYMGWLRKQPVPKRKHSNPERTLANRIGDVRIFLKEFGITKLLKKNEEPKYHEKKVVAHPDDELDVLYGAADADETFLLDFFIGTMARDHEAYGKYGDPDLTGTTLTLYGKHHKTRTVEITQRLADAVRLRRKRSNSKACGWQANERRIEPAGIGRLREYLDEWIVAAHLHWMRHNFWNRFPTKSKFVSKKNWQEHVESRKLFENLSNYAKKNPNIIEVTYSEAGIPLYAEQKRSKHILRFG